MNLRKVVTIAFMIVCTAAVASSALVQKTQTASANGLTSQLAAEPLSKKRLLKLLTLNDSTQQELVQIVGRKGVDFQASPSDERELHDAGASDDLIVAVRANYRSGAQANQQSIATSDANGAAAQGQAQAGNPSSAPQPPKKKGFLTKFNEKLSKVNSTLATQSTNTQTSDANQPGPTTPQTVAPTGPANIVAPDTQTTVAQPVPPGTNTTVPALPGQKKGFLNKLNQGLDKANAKLTKVAATLNPGVTQTTTQTAPANPNAPVTTAPGNPPGATTGPTTAPLPQTPPGNATQGSAPSGLAGTYWNVMSMTEKGETEKKSDAPGPDVEFCTNGKWGMLHYGGAREAGTYQVQGGRVLMKMEDGSLFGNFQIKRNGNEMTLDDGKYVLRMKYIHPAGCQ